MESSRRVALAVAVAGLAAGLAGCHSHAAGSGAAAHPITPVALPRANPEAQSEFDQGVVVMKMGRKHYKDARAHFAKAVQLDGKLFEAWHDLGVVETALGNYDKAVEDFEKALDVQPGSRKTVLAYGESLRRAHRPQKAAKVYAKWLDSDPKDAEMRARYGQVLREAGDLDQSLEEARQILSQGGSSGENVAQAVVAYNALGLTYYKMGKLDLAETAFRKSRRSGRKERVRLEQPRARRVRSGTRPGGFPELSEGIGARCEIRAGAPQQGVRVPRLRRLQARPRRAPRGGAHRSQRRRGPGGARRRGPRATGASRDEARRAYMRALDIEGRLRARPLQPGRPLHGLPDKDPRRKPRRSSRSTCSRATRPTPSGKRPGRASRSFNETSNETSNETANDARPPARPLAPAGRVVDGPASVAARSRAARVPPLAAAIRPAEPSARPRPISRPRPQGGGQGRRRRRRRRPGQDRRRQDHQDEDVHVRRHGRRGQAQDAPAPVLPQTRQARARHVGPRQALVHEGVGPKRRRQEPLSSTTRKHELVMT